MFKLTLIALILFVTTAINFVVSYISWRRRKTRGGLYFALGMLGVTLWTLAAALDYAAIPLTLKIFFAKIEAIGYLSALPLFTLFSISYAEHNDWLEKEWGKAFFGLITIVNVLLVITNDLHRLVWTGYVPVSNNVVIFEHGAAFGWLKICNYLMVIIMLANLWMASRKGSDLSKQQARLLVLSLLFSIAANLIYQFGIGGMGGMDWTSITFSVTGLLILRALYGTSLLDLVPIARDKLVNSISDGMIVLDMQERIIDINQIASNMIGVPSKILISKNLADFMPFPHSFLERQLEHEIKTELEVGTPHKRYFDVLISPLREEPNKIIGRLITFRDITERKENELRLLQLTQAVEQSPSTVIITDIKGKIKYVNPQFNILTGYATNEVLGKNPNIIQSGLTPDEYYREMWQTIKAGKTWRGEFLNKKKNGELYWEHVVVAPVLDNEGRIINFIAIKEDITERKQAEKALAQRFLEIEELNKNLQEAQAQLVEQQRALAQLEERKRIGRDMHDSVNQSIHSLMLFSDTLSALLVNNQVQEAIDVVKRIQKSGQQALEEIRLLVFRAQTQVVDENIDLISLLDERLNMVERRVGIKAEIVCEAGTMGLFPSTWKENLYWIIIEALNNSLKHASARSINVVFRCVEELLEVQVKDDGVGFDPSYARSGGFGVRSMRERAGLLGGELSVKSSPNHGTCVHFKAVIGA